MAGKKYNTFIAICFFILLFLSAPFLRAVKATGLDSALKSVFPDAETVSSEKKTLTERQYKNILAELKSGSLLRKPDPEGKIREEREYNFYFALKNGKKAGVALVETQPTAWGPLELLVALDNGGAVKAVKILSYESRARKLTNKSYLKRFLGFSGSNHSGLDKIAGVSGATASCDAAVFSVRKAILLYREFYLK